MAKLLKIFGATELNNLDYKSLSIFEEFHIEICVQEDVGLLLLL